MLVFLVIRLSATVVDEIYHEALAWAVTIMMHQPVSVAQLNAHLTGDQEVACSTLAGSAIFFCGY